MSQPSDQAPRPGVRVRRMNDGDLLTVMAIDRASSPRPWTVVQFADLLRAPGIAVFVAEATPDVVGFAACERRGDELALLSFAVDSRVRRQGVGRLLVQAARELAAAERRRAVVATARDSDLTARLFLRALGFRAARILRGHFADSGEDGYVLEWRV